MKPEFHLGRVFEDGTSEEPRIVPVAEMPWSTSMDRRGALAAGLGLSGVLAMLGCGESEEPRPTPALPSTCRTSYIRLRAHRGRILALAAASNGRGLLSTGEDLQLKIWRVPGGQPRTSARLTQAATAMAFGPDTTVMAVAQRDMDIAIFSTDIAFEQQRLQGHRDGVSSLVFTPNGEHLISAGNDGAVKVWERPSGDLRATLEAPRGAIVPIAVSADSSMLAYAGKLWSVADRKAMATLEADGGDVTALAFMPDGKIVAAGTKAGPVRLWSVAERKLVATLEGHDGAVRRLATTPDGSVLASSSLDGSIRLWSIPERKQIGLLAGGPRDFAAAMAVVANGTLLAVGGRDGAVRFWSLPAGKLSVTFRGHPAAIEHLAPLPTTNLLASADIDGGLYLWDVSMPGGQCLHAALYDAEASEDDVRAAAYTISENAVAYTMPCGSEIPENAFCTCNCVGKNGPDIKPGSPGTSTSSGGIGGGSVCTCNKVCTCIPVSSRRWKRNVEPLRAPLPPRSTVHRITLLVNAIQSQQRRLADLRRRLDEMQR